MIDCLKRELAQAGTAIESIEFAIERAHAKRIADSTLHIKPNKVSILHDPQKKPSTILRLADGIRHALAKLGARLPESSSDHGWSARKWSH